MNKPAICPVCKTFCHEGWQLDFVTEKVEVYSLKGHRCPEQRPKRLIPEYSTASQDEMEVRAEAAARGY